MTRSAPKRTKKLAEKKPVKKTAIKQVVKKGLGGEYPLETAFELIEFLKVVHDQCAREGKWKGKVILLPCDLNCLYFLGRDSSMIYISRGGRGRNLRGIYPREFLPLFWKTSHKVLLRRELWVFDAYGTGPFPQRYKVITDQDLTRRIEDLLQEFVKNMEKTREVALQRGEGNQPAWKVCPICNPIPDSSYGLWKGGNLETGGIPAHEDYLEIVGVPFFNDSTSYRHWCVKRCPQCSTCYQWTFDYEYLVNGSEDEISLTRLSDADAKTWLKKVLDEIRESEERLQTNAPRHIENLNAAGDPKAVRAAADFFYHEQLVNGHDLTFAVPALVYALARHAHVEGTACAGYWIAAVLRDFAYAKKENLQYLLKQLELVKVAPLGTEFATLRGTITVPDFEPRELL